MEFGKIAERTSSKKLFKRTQSRAGRQNPAEGGYMNCKKISIELKARTRIAEYLEKEFKKIPEESAADFLVNRVGT